MLYLDGEPEPFEEELDDGIPDVGYDVFGCWNCGKTLSFMFFEGDHEDMERSKKRAMQEHEAKSPDCAEDAPVSREEIDEVLDFLTEEYIYEEREDIVYTTTTCFDCGGGLPLSYRRGDNVEYLESLRRSRTNHRCPQEEPLVKVITEDGTYSLEEYLRLHGG